MVWASAFVGLCVVYLWFFGTQTFFALYARQIGRKIPIVKSVPVDLKDLSVSELKGERVSFMEAEFEVPWDDVDEEKTRIAGNWALIHFRSGNSIILCVAQADGFIANMAKSKTPDPQLFKEIYGPDVLRSDYALHKAIFETTPSQINLLTPASRAAGLSSVIFIKGHNAANDGLGHLQHSVTELQRASVGRPGAPSQEDVLGTVRKRCAF